ncbi:MAG: radical SAM protein [Methanosarcina sp.]
MRVNLIKPPESSRMNFGCFSLAVLASAVRDIASIRIIDATNLTIEEAVSAAVKDKPDIIGITTMGLASVGATKTFLQALRSAGFNGVLIAGGHGASMSPKVLLESGADSVVCGEGEITFRELLRHGVSEKVQGIYLKRDGALIKTLQRPLIESLDSLQEPAYDLAGEPSDGIFLLETSRGCPHGCTFCETTRFHGRRWRARSPEIVVEDIRHLVSSHSAMIIQIADDNFMASPERVKKICEALRDGPMPLFFLFSARSDDLLLHPEVITSLSNARFLRATIGVETVNPELSKSIHKIITFEQHKQAFAALKDAGIFSVASFIVGLPGETEEMRSSYVDIAVDIGADAARFLPFQPLPGTPMESGTGEPDPLCAEYAVRTTKEFERHNAVLNRLLEAAEKFDVRGMLARASLQRRLNENILDASDTVMVQKRLLELDLG